MPEREPQIDPKAAIVGMLDELDPMEIRTFANLLSNYLQFRWAANANEEKERTLWWRRVKRSLAYLEQHGGLGSLRETF